jgi:hypothetical protein
MSEEIMAGMPWPGIACGRKGMLELADTSAILPSGSGNADSKAGVAA